MPPVGGPHPGPAPHVNPAFFQPQHQGAPNSQGDPYRMQQAPNQYGHDYRGPVGGGDANMMPPISEAEFEEIMNKNKSVSSSAISRAVADCSSG